MQSKSWGPIQTLCMAALAATIIVFGLVATGGYDLAGDIEHLIGSYEVSK